MNKLVRLLGVAFITIAVFTAIFLMIAVSNYNNVTETRVKLPENIHISEVRIPEIADESQNVIVDISLNITNPSKMTVYVTNVEAFVYMDNRSDPRPFLEKRSELLVGIAQFTLSKEQAHIVKPGESKTVHVGLEVTGGTRYLSILNTTTDGKYFPVIEATLRYTYEHVDIIEIVGGIFFGGPVEPYS